MAASISSATSTRGGVDYDLLRTGDPHFIYYSFNITNLEGAENLKDAVDIVYRKICDVLSDMYIGTGKRIGQFYIGKTFTHKHKKRVFNPLDPNTFRKEGISSRWRTHKEKSYGKNGMVVVAVVTHPVAVRLGYADTQKCALKIEEELQKRFRNDGRLANDKTYHEGSKEQKGAIGYPLYVAFSLLEERQRR